MEQITFLTGTLSFLILLLISSFTFLFSRKFKLPYTVLLVVVWLLLVPLSNTEMFSFINHFKLTPDVLFFIFLPTLLFEASYKINYKKMVQDWRAIWLLAVVWITISSLIIWGWLYFIFGLLGMQIPFLVTLLFWVIISATDPVAVLAIFQTLWAPKRLALLFEWESLFNDGTAVALFIVILGIIMSWAGVNLITFTEWFTAFLSMMVWWTIFGWLIWIFFAKFVWSIKNAESVEIMLTMVLAHITFLLAELTTHFLHHSLHIEYLGVSGVVATVIAWIVMWNYWKYKITPKVEHHVEQMWEFFAFVSNSIVFILIWLIVSELGNIKIIDLILPISISIIVVAFARAVSVYWPIWILNFFNLGEKIPMSWQHIMSWGSLRWSLALMMVLLIPWEWQENFEKIQAFQLAVNWPYDYSIKDFILVIVISCIMFTLLIKATTIPLLMKKTGVSKLLDFEIFEYFEWNILMLFKVMKKIEMMHNKWGLTKSEYIELKEKYSKKLDTSVKNLGKFLKSHKRDSDELIKRAISIHSLWAEKKFLKELFLWNEVWEKNFRYILRKIEKQIDRLYSNKKQFRKKWKNDYDFFQLLSIKFHKEKDLPSEAFIRYRAKKIITQKVITEITELSKLNLGFEKNAFKETIEFYKEIHKKAEKNLEALTSLYPNETIKLDTKLAEKSIFTLEESVINEMLNKWIISDKLYIRFKNEIDQEFYSDVTENINTFTK